MRTYNSKKVTIALGSHIVSGYAEDTFVSIEETGDGVTSVAGADGEVARSVSPDPRYTVKISLLQNSSSNDFLLGKLKQDKKNGNGTFPMLIKDLSDGTIFSADVSWAVKSAPFTRGKTVANREWELCAVGDFED